MHVCVYIYIYIYIKLSYSRQQSPHRTPHAHNIYNKHIVSALPRARVRTQRDKQKPSGLNRH